MLFTLKVRVGYNIGFMETKDFEKLIIDLTNSENGNSIIYFLNVEEKRIIFCLSKWLIIDGIFDEDKWKYDTLEINKRTHSDLIFLVEDLISRYPDYSINLLKIV